MKFSTLNTSLGDSSLSPSSSLYAVSKGEGGKYPNKFKIVFSGGGVDFPIIWMLNVDQFFLLSSSLTLLVITSQKMH